MATVETVKGVRRVRFYDSRGIRQTIGFGRVPLTTAKSAASWIQSLVNDRIAGETPRAASVEWASGQKPRIYNALVKLDLLPDREGVAGATPVVVPTLQEWTDQYIATRKGSDGSRLVWGRSQKHALRYFGASRRIDTITTAMAIDWYEFMQMNGLAQATARKMVSVQRHMFKRAIKAQILTVNPFHDDELPVSIGCREKEYIDMDVTNRVLQILPSVEWRAVFVLARIGGLRVQCEAPLIKWEQIDWEHGSMTFYSPKTKSWRTVPLFPDLRQALEDLLEVTGDGEYILNALRLKSRNWRKPFGDMLQRAGIEPWADLWNSLRASAATDIAREYGSACESEWVGHSEQTALQHYRRATPLDHEQAIKSAPKTYQPAGPQRADLMEPEGTKSQRRQVSKGRFHQQKR